MKTKILTTIFSFAFVLVIAIGIQSCKKTVDGCTDSSAINFNSSANENNGSCVYKGNATFWIATIDSLPQVTVTMADNTTGTITLSYSGNGSAPACNAAGCFTYRNNPGTYAFNATDGTENWSGQVTIISDGCATQRLSK